MEIFICQNCHHLIDFISPRCEECGNMLGFFDAERKLLTLIPKENSLIRLTGENPKAFRYCKNADYGACNWLVEVTSAHHYCRACRFNRTVPNLSIKSNVDRWRKIEHAKHRLIYSLLRLGLPLYNKYEDPKGLAFDFLAEMVGDDMKYKRVITGHSSGVITLNIKEADDVEREKTRQSLAEVYRTLLGHLRHEIGHYYWYRLIANSSHLEQFRQIFGDETQCYSLARSHHYSKNPKDFTSDDYISRYASAHPWEDWAETWAHYLHIIDTLDTAFAFGLKIIAHRGKDTPMMQQFDKDPYNAQDLNEILDKWTPLTIAVNNLNRSMGQPDLYPFVINKKLIIKLYMVHTIIQEYSISQ